MLHVLVSAQNPCTFWSKWGITNKAYFPVLCEGLRCGPQKFPIFFGMEMTYSQSNLRCVAQSMFAFSYIFGKLLINILNILGHDVKPCDQNLPSSQYFTCILMNSTSICIAQDVAKIYAFCMWFKFCLVAFKNALTSLQYYSFMSIHI
jgi:hypothetical protein